MLGIGPETVVDVSLDGNRIVVEVVPPNEVERTRAERELTADAMRVLRELTRTYLMSDAAFARLHYGRPRILYYEAWIEQKGWERSPPEQVDNMKRMRECWRALRAGQTWEAAIGAALRAYPKPDAPVL